MTSHVGGMFNRSRADFVLRSDELQAYELPCQFTALDRAFDTLQLQAANIAVICVELSMRLAYHLEVHGTSRNRS